MACTRGFARLIGLVMLPVLMGGALEALARADGDARFGDIPCVRAGQGLLDREPPRAERGRHGRPVRHADPGPGRGPAPPRRGQGRGPRRGDILILVHAGRHELAEPLVLAPEDSGTAESRIVFAAAPGDEGRAVLSGGRVVSGWKAARGPRGEWVADLPGLKDGWRFRHVSVNGRWRGRTRLPDGETSTYTMAGLAGADAKAAYDTPADRFEYAPGQIDPGWTGLRDVEVVVPHFWLDSHLKIAAVEPGRRVVKLDRPSHYKFTDEHQPGPGRYYVANVYEALRPGRFYANAAAGTLHYMPREGESPDRVHLVAPRLASLVEFRGDPGSGRFVEHLTLRGLTFSDTAWEPGPRDAMDVQASSQVPGAVDRHRGEARRDRGMRAEEPRRLRDRPARRLPRSAPRGQ